MLSRWWATQQRKKGRYVRQTLGLMFAAFQKMPSQRNWLGWLQLRRDWGLPLRARYVRQLESMLPKLSVRHRGVAVAMLLEHRLQKVTDEAGVDVALEWPLAWRREAAVLRPALASCLLPSNDPLRLAAGPVADVAAAQAVWRPALEALMLSALHGKGLALVGNAAHVRGIDAGAGVDASDCVVRFNHYARHKKAVQDVGSRLDVWVVAPGYRGVLPDVLPQWVVVTGPAVEFSLKDWSIVQPLLAQGVGVVTVPLAVWRLCVQRLNAPPSAGVLMLHWLELLLGDELSSVKVLGMGFEQGRVDPTKRLVRPNYHAALPQYTRGKRHNWMAESQWLQQRFVQQGAPR